MEKDLPVETDVSTETEVVTEESPKEETDTEQDDYRAKLNIQNRFLEKEGYKFEDGKWIKPQAPVKTETPAKSDGLSSKDIIALSKADVHEDDLDEILDYAKYKKISIGEALKSGVIKTLLKEKQDQRKVAQASNTGTARRGSVKVSDEEIVEKLEKGEAPEDPEALAKARWNLKKKK